MNGIFPDLSIFVWGLLFLVVLLFIIFLLGRAK